MLTLGDLLAEVGGSIRTGPFGTVLKANEYAHIGVPIISVGEIGYGTLRLLESTPRASDALLERLPEYILRTGDIVFARKGAVDRSAWVGPGQDGWFLGSDGIRVRVSGDLESKYLSYQFQTDHVREWLKQHAAGTTMASLNATILERIPVTLVSPAAQRTIAEVLGALDDKIAANTRLIHACEALASAVFDSLPHGLRQPLTKLAYFVNGKAFTKGATGTGRVVIRIAELNSGLGGSTVYNDIDVRDEHLARPGDLLFAWSGSLTVHRWYRSEGIINQHIFKVIPRSPHPMWLVHQILLRRLADFRLIAADKATTMGHIQRRHLEEPVPVPATEAIAHVDVVMTTLWERALSAEQETLMLAELRDTLLPQLMSGKLRVRDAEQQIEAAV